MYKNFSLFVDGGEEDESPRKAVDDCKDYPLSVASSLGGEEPDNEAKAKCDAKDNAVPDRLHQSNGQGLLPEIFLSRDNSSLKK